MFHVEHGCNEDGLAADDAAGRKKIGVRLTREGEAPAEPAFDQLLAEREAGPPAASTGLISR